MFRVSVYKGLGKKTPITKDFQEFSLLKSFISSVVADEMWVKWVKSAIELLEIRKCAVLDGVLEQNYLWVNEAKIGIG